MKTLFSPVIDFIQVVLRTLHDMGLSWPVGIIVLTLIMRILLLPIALKGRRSMMHFIAIQPEVKRIRENEASVERAKEKIVDLYKEAGFNPFYTFSLLIIQIPLFVGLFYALRSDQFRLELGTQNSFLGLEHLGYPITYFPLIITLIFVLGYFILQLVSSWSSYKYKVVEPGRFFLIIFLAFFAGSFALFIPSGLLLSLITTALFLLIQNYLFFKLKLDEHPDNIKEILSKS